MTGESLLVEPLSRHSMVADRPGASARPFRRGAAADALLVTTPANIRWLTGFTGSAGVLLVTGDVGPAHDRRSLPDPGRRAVGRGGRPAPSTS